MTSTEAMIYQLKNLKGKPLKQKIEHIVTYFWLPIVMVLAFLIVIGSYIVHLVTVKDVALSVICLNVYTDSEDRDAFMTEFAEKAEIDLNEYDVQISANLTLDGTNPSTDYNTVQMLAAQISAHSVDLLACDLEIATGYFYQDIYWDLNQLLTEQQKTRYAEYFLYADMAFARRLLEEQVESVEFPDPTKPEEMEEPIPVALLVPSDSNFADAYYPYNLKDVAVGIIATSENLENALAFLDHIMP